MKLTNLRTHWRLWTTGIALGLIGVILARVVAFHYSGKTQTILVSLGRLIAFAGLIVIAFGIKKRNSDTSNNAS